MKNVHRRLFWLMLALPCGWSGAATAQPAAPSSSVAPSGVVAPPSPTTPSSSAAPPSAVAPPSAARVSPPPSTEPLERLPASGGLPAIAVARHAEQLWVASCRGGCDWQHAVALDAPPEIARAISPTHIRRLRIGAARQVLHLTAAAGGDTWHAVVAPPLQGPTPSLVYAGVSGWRSGQPGERVGQAVEFYDKARGEVDVVVGQLREDVQLCGRRTLLSPKLLYAPQMELRAIRLQRLPQAERDAAQRLTAAVNTSPVEHPVLQSVAASSGGSAVELTDGDPASAWSEQRGADGSGEFVVMQAPEQLALSELHLRVKPTSDAPSSGVAPKELWLVSDAGLYHVSLPLDAWSEAATTVLSVVLPQPINTSCLALVLESAYTSEDAEPGATPSVTLAEVSARAVVSDEQLRDAVTALGRGEREAEPASRLLAGLGAAAYEPLLQGFVKLPEVGRLRALQLLDAAPCPVAARAFAVAVDGSGGALQEHGMASIRRCGTELLPQLAEVVAGTGGARLRLLGELLVELSPDAAVDVAVHRLARANSAVRSELRNIIAQAALQPDGQAAVRRWLAMTELDPKAAIDLLRALDDQLVAFQPLSGQRLKALLAGNPDFRTRYLLVGPLAQLAPTDRESADILLRYLTGDPQPAVRTAAARLALPTRPGVEPSKQGPSTSTQLTSALVRAASDEHVRVREAAVTALGEHEVADAVATLLRHLEEDPWPIVRAASVRSLRHLPSTPEVLAALAETAELDVSPEVRRPALLSLGSLDGHAHLEVVRESYESDPDPYVQAAAAATLGQLCDATMADELTASSMKLTSIGSSERDTIVGRASLAALGRLNPPDLKRRLAPFASPEVPVLARRAAELALSHPDPCSR